MVEDQEQHFSVRLEAELKKMGIWYKFVEKPDSTIHTADAAQITGINLHEISKSLVAKTSTGQYAVLIIPGDGRLDYKSAARLLKVKSISLVPFNFAHEISGYPPGGTPSVGFTGKVGQVIVDSELAARDTFYCGGGSTKKLLELKAQDVIKVNRAMVGDIAQKGQYANSVKDSQR